MGAGLNFAGAGQERTKDFNPGRTVSGTVHKDVSVHLIAANIR